MEMRNLKDRLGTMFNSHAKDKTMTCCSHKDFYDLFVSNGHACVLIEKIATYEKGTYIQGIFHVPGIFFHQNTNIHLYDRNGKIIDFPYGNAVSFFSEDQVFLNKKEKHFLSLADEKVKFNREDFETAYPCKRGWIELKDVFLSDVFTGCVLTSQK